MTIHGLKLEQDGRRPLSDRDIVAITRAASTAAESHDRDGSFPGEALAALQELEPVGVPPIEPHRALALLRILAAAGRGDLNVGRILEGHFNALLLVASYGTPGQRVAWGQARGGRLAGVWNTDAPGNAVRLEGRRLVGAKSFATGVDGLSHAIITAVTGEGRQMVLVPLENPNVDRSWWTPMGMRASGSHLVDFSGIEVEPDWLLGGPDDYIEEPWFSTGAIRFAAVHVGGAHAVFDAARDHLVRTGRHDNPHQQQRLGRMALRLQSSYGWLPVAAAAWRDAAGSAEDAERAIATANAMRLAVEEDALAILELAERGVGAAGFLQPHPLERLMRDLRTYLRQPNPDGALDALGRCAADGTFEPGLIGGNDGC